MKSNFERAANSLLRRYDELDHKTREALELFRKGMTEEANALMGEVTRMMEKAAAISRKLPLYTGNPNAQNEVEAIIAEECPVEMGFTEEGWFLLRMPPLAICDEMASKDYIRGILYPAMRRFWAGKDIVRYPRSVIIFRHVYSRDRPERRKRDYDNVEVKFVIDTVVMYVLEDDSPGHCEQFHCTAAGAEEHTEAYVVPVEEFPDWYRRVKLIPDDGLPITDVVPEKWKIY